MKTEASKRFVEVLRSANSNGNFYTFAEEICYEEWDETDQSFPFELVGLEAIVSYRDGSDFDTMNVVVKLNDHYFSISGFYSSYNGTEFNDPYDWQEVFPIQVLRDEWSSEP